MVEKALQVVGEILEKLSALMAKEGGYGLGVSYNFASCDRDSTS